MYDMRYTSPTDHQHQSYSTKDEDNASWKLCHNFNNWLVSSKAEEEGVNGKGEPTKYVASGKLQSYWTTARLQAILGSEPPEMPINKFWIRSIDDDNLPLLDSSSTPFGDSPTGQKAWGLFSQSQWKFIPLQFRFADGTVIDRSHSITDMNQILPIAIERVIYQSHPESTRVLKILPHDASGLEPKKPIAMKIYPKKHHSQDFQHERAAYTWITNNIAEEGPQDYKKCFLEYHGCFIQGDSCILLLEYADEGSLMHFFDANAYLPRWDQEALDLWEDLSQLFIGLAHLHRSSRTKPRIHQDIRPENILVSKDLNRPGRFSFRLGDFGITSAAIYYKNGQPTGQLNYGTPIFTSPEVANIQENVPMCKEASLPSDVFSLGCVLYDCAVWMSLHNRGRVAFFNERVKETETLTHVQRAGYSGAFHDGFKILDIVRNKKETVEQLGSPVARVCHNVMDFILSWMLSEERSRGYAHQLPLHFKNHLSRHALNHSPSSPVHRSSCSIPMLRPPIASSLLSTDHSYRESYLEIPQVYSPEDMVGNPFSRQPSERQSTASPPNDTPVSRRETGASKGVLGNGSDHARPPSELPGTAIQLQAAPRPLTPLQTYSVEMALRSLRDHREKAAPLPPYIDKIQKRLQSRDIYIIVDSSTSMEPYWQEAKQTAQAVFEIGLKADPDGVDIRMTNGDTTSRRRKKSDDLFGRYQYFENQRPTAENGPCDMQSALNNVLDIAIKKGLSKKSKFLERTVGRGIKGISVFVLTNGVWFPPGDDEAGGVQHPVYNAIDKLKSKYRDSRFLVIQFVGFGKDQTGINRMTYLDNSLKRDKTDRDIVDFVHWNGSVEKIMIGALDAAVDKEPPVDDGSSGSRG
ncbi:hypothetical protein F5B18DRAFT_549573 [Nemania serpens]|nr:hypothetical protein F5B18DRAFT_549573 [Nemania serpens]